MSTSTDIESVAVVGLSGRFPGASNVREFWDNILNGRECISCFSDEELLSNGADFNLISDPKYVRARGVLDNVDLFDTDFFNLNVREAKLTDPQHRIFLECAWEAVEDAGYTPKTIEGSIGVFAGSSLNTYLIHHIFSDPNIAKTFISGFQADGYHLLIGNDKDYLATRVAHKLNFKGPAITIQTACSTSLVAVVQACQSLLNYQCDAALAGGVSITLPQQRGYIYQEGAIASSDGHCRSFDANATGTVFGSGCGIVLLKRLSDAVSDGDLIYAVIKGSAINNDGSDKVSFSAPNIEGQSEVIALAQALAGITADTVDYVEAHGTGTPLGDPIEVTALTNAFRATTDLRQYCGLGSVKTNVGHLEAAAGITGLIKTCLAIYNRQIPPSLHFKEPNPNIDFDRSPFYVVKELTEWPKNDHPCRAGVSSFGMGGTNAHVILEEPPNRPARNIVPTMQIIPISAKTPQALIAVCNNLGAHLNKDRTINSTNYDTHISDVAYTLQEGRDSFPYRHAIVGKDCTEASNILLNVEEINKNTPTKASLNNSIAFIFPGQGTQRINMCRDLYENDPLFKKVVGDCSKILMSDLGLDLRQILYPDSTQKHIAEEKINYTAIAQPALFTIGYALSKLLISWNIKPEVLSGHSIGEFIVAVLAGVMSLEDGLKLVAHRGRLMQGMPKGVMLAVRSSESEVLPLLEDGLSVASINAPKSIVVSGPKELIEIFKHTLSSKSIGYRELITSHAFHSNMMTGASENFLLEVRKIALYPPKINIVSTKTGKLIVPSEWVEPEYWSDQMLSPVRFMDAATVLLKDPSMIILDIGPGHTLTNLVRQNPARKPDNNIISCTPLTDEDGDQTTLLKAVGKLWSSGIDVDWNAVRGPDQRYRVSLPTYPFERKRIWINNFRDTNNSDTPTPGKMNQSIQQATSSQDSQEIELSSSNIEKIITDQLQMMTDQLHSISNFPKKK